MKLLNVNLNSAQNIWYFNSNIGNINKNYDTITADVSLNLIKLANRNKLYYFNFFKSIVHYGDNIGARLVKCIINESSYESQTLLKNDYDIYQVFFF
jgi:hypothetical protein